MKRIGASRAYYFLRDISFRQSGYPQFVTTRLGEVCTGPLSMQCYESRYFVIGISDRFKIPILIETLMHMKKMIGLVTMLFAMLTFQPAFAQPSTEDIVKEWERAKTFTKQYLDSMPESGYSYKPKPEMRSFAEQMLHLTDGNYGFGAAATGEKSPVGMGESEKATDKSKANVTKLVLAGYDFVIIGIKKMTPAQLNETVKLFGR
ncbi:DinB family protein, partial [Flavitalea sp.]|nr:DinB family protein [Flavitalea sp.]